jgi:hypothetical protein
LKYSTTVVDNSVKCETCKDGFYILDGACKKCIAEADDSPVKRAKYCDPSNKVIQCYEQDAIGDTVDITKAANGDTVNRAQPPHTNEWYTVK